MNFISKVKGVVSFENEIPVLLPISQGDGRPYIIKGKFSSKITDGSLVECMITRKKFRHVKILKILAQKVFSKSLNSLTLIEKEIPTSFPEDLITESSKINKPYSMDLHKNLTNLPFVTVDPSDAKDHDDAIYALKEVIGKNNSIYRVYVAIADVSYFVTENSEIDLVAKERGNSTYLPGLCIPMLPEYLSFDLCSLRENEIRPCILVEMVISDRGEKTSHTFHRALIKNRKALTYLDLEHFRLNGSTRSSSYTKSLTALCEVYELLKEITKKRSPLELNFTETSIEINNEDRVTKIEIDKKNVSHSIIEELMILANICAIETIQQKFGEALFRVHPAPSNDKLSSIFSIEVGKNLRNKDETSTALLNKLIKSTNDPTEKFSVQNKIIQILEQASYSTKNIGHFGLNLDRYTHFTSPIRRYSDIVIHRLLIHCITNTIDLGKYNSTEMSKICKHISLTEKRSSDAERSAVRRYLARYMKRKLNEDFEGQIVNISRKVIFVKLDYLNAEGAIIVKQGKNDPLYFDKNSHGFRSRKTLRKIGIGAKISVKLIDANELNGRLTFEYLS